MTTIKVLNTYINIPANVMLAASISRLFKGKLRTISGIFPETQEYKADKPASANVLEMIPWTILLFINGALIKLHVAPTNSIFFMINRWACSASFKVLKIKTLDIASKIKVKTKVKSKNLFMFFISEFKKLS